MSGFKYCRLGLMLMASIYAPFSSGGISFNVQDGETADEVRNVDLSDDSDPIQFASQITQPLIEPDESDDYSVSASGYPDAYLPQNWVTAELLWWWTKGNELPALVTSSPALTPRASAGVLPGATTIFGNEAIDDEMRHGLRISFGHWADSGQTIGLQGTYFGLFDDEKTGDFAAGTDGVIGMASGSPIIARPFYNILLNQEDSELVSYPNVVDGTVSVHSSSEMHSASALLRQYVREGDRGRLDILYGYRYFRLREGLLVEEGLISTDPGGLVAIGTAIAIEDQFLTENDFHGSELGFVAEFWRGYWTCEILAKVALGNLHRSVNVNGSTTIDTPPPGGASTSSGGLLAQPSNIGRRSDNDFAALPEFGLNLKFEPADNLLVQVGYTSFFLDGVSRTGEQIDRIINPSQLSGGALIGQARPQTLLANETDFWAHGLTMGVTLTR